MEENWCSDPEILINATSIGITGWVLPGLALLYVYRISKKKYLPEIDGQTEFSISTESGNDRSLIKTDIVVIIALLCVYFWWQYSSLQKNKELLNSNNVTVYQDQLTSVYPQNIYALFYGKANIRISGEGAGAEHKYLQPNFTIHSSISSLLNGLTKGCINPSCGLEAGDNVQITYGNSQILKLAVCKQPSKKAN